MSEAQSSPVSGLHVVALLVVSLIFFTLLRGCGGDPPVVEKPPEESGPTVAEELTELRQTIAAGSSAERSQALARVAELADNSDETLKVLEARLNDDDAEVQAATIQALMACDTNGTTVQSAMKFAAGEEDDSVRSELWGLAGLLTARLPEEQNAESLEQLEAAVVTGEQASLKGISLADESAFLKSVGDNKGDKLSNAGTTIVSGLLSQTPHSGSKTTSVELLKSVAAGNSSVVETMVTALRGESHSVQGAIAPVVETALQNDEAWSDADSLQSLKSTQMPMMALYRVSGVPAAEEGQDPAATSETKQKYVDTLLSDLGNSTGAIKNELADSSSPRPVRQDAAMLLMKFVKEASDDQKPVLAEALSDGSFPLADVIDDDLRTQVAVGLAAGEIDNSGVQPQLFSGLVDTKLPAAARIDAAKYLKVDPANADGVKDLAAALNETPENKSEAAPGVQLALLSAIAAYGSAGGEVAEPVAKLVSAPRSEVAISALHTLATIASESDSLKASVAASLPSENTELQSAALKIAADNSNLPADQLVAPLAAALDSKSSGNQQLALGLLSGMPESVGKADAAIRSGLLSKLTGKLDDSEAGKQALGLLTSSGMLADETLAAEDRAKGLGAVVESDKSPAGLEAALSLAKLDPNSATAAERIAAEISGRPSDRKLQDAAVKLSPDGKATVLKAIADATAKKGINGSTLTAMNRLAAADPLTVSAIQQGLVSPKAKVADAAVGLATKLPEKPAAKIQAALLKGVAEKPSSPTAATAMKALARLTKDEGVLEQLAGFALTTKNLSNQAAGLLGRLPENGIGVVQPALAGKRSKQAIATLQGNMKAKSVRGVLEGLQATDNPASQAVASLLLNSNPKKPSEGYLEELKKLVETGEWSDDAKGLLAKLDPPKPPEPKEPKKDVAATESKPEMKADSDAKTKPAEAAAKDGKAAAKSADAAKPDADMKPKAGDSKDENEKPTGKPSEAAKPSKKDGDSKVESIPPPPAATKPKAGDMKKADAKPADVAKPKADMKPKAADKKGTSEKPPTKPSKKDGKGQAENAPPPPAATKPKAGDMKKADGKAAGKPKTADKPVKKADKPSTSRAPKDKPAATTKPAPKKDAAAGKASPDTKKPQASSKVRLPGNSAKAGAATKPAMVPPPPTPLPPSVPAVPSSLSETAMPPAPPAPPAPTSASGFVPSKSVHSKYTDERGCSNSVIYRFSSPMTTYSSSHCCQ